MLKVVGFLACVTVASAALARFPPEPKPAEFEDKPGCWISKINRMLPQDEYFYPNIDCSRYICQSNTNETLYETCGALSIRDGCRKSSVDNSKQYPRCCGTEICDATTVTPTTEAPTTLSDQSSAYASAESADGQPPKIVKETSGPSAQAEANAS